MQVMVCNLQEDLCNVITFLSRRCLIKFLAHVAYACIHYEVMFVEGNNLCVGLCVADIGNGRACPSLLCVPTAISTKHLVWKVSVAKSTFPLPITMTEV